MTFLEIVVEAGTVRSLSEPLQTTDHTPKPKWSIIDIQTAIPCPLRQSAVCSRPDAGWSCRRRPKTYPTNRSVATVTGWP